MDYVDFGARQVPLSIPRISVWKGSMIRDYADFGSKSPGCYGYHPLLDISRTCFSKVSCFFSDLLILHFVCFLLFLIFSTLQQNILFYRILGSLAIPPLFHSVMISKRSSILLLAAHSLKS